MKTTGPGYVLGCVSKAGEAVSLAQGGIYYRTVGDGCRKDDGSKFLSAADNERVTEAHTKLLEAAKLLNEAYRMLYGVNLGFSE